MSQYQFTETQLLEIHRIANENHLNPAFYEARLKDEIDKTVSDFFKRQEEDRASREERLMSDKDYYERGKR